MLERMCKRWSNGNKRSVVGQRLLMGSGIQEVDVIFMIVDKPDELRVAANGALSATLNTAGVRLTAHPR